MVLSSSRLVLAILLLVVMSCSLSNDAVLIMISVLIVDVFKQLISRCAGVDKVNISNAREDRFCQFIFLHWQGDQKSFVSRGICGHL